MRIIRGVRFLFLIIVVFFSFADLDTFAQDGSSKQEAIEKVFRETFPNKSFLTTCHQPLNNGTGMDVTIQGSRASVYCMSRYQGANVKIDISVASHYNNRSSDFGTTSVGDKKIGYIVINLLGRKAALREYNNGSYKNRDVEIYGDSFRFSVGTAGEEIMSRKEFFSVISEIDIDTFTKTTRALLGIK
ncbi:MAG: hypothetical protein ABIK92_19880 [Pseudomonadota bacterium]